MPGEVIERAITQYEVDVGQAVSGLRQFTEAQERASQAVTRGARESATAVSAATTNNVIHLSKYKENLSRARETTMYFTQSLAGFGPAGRTAQFAISGIAGMLMGGGLLAVALEAARIGIKYLADRWNETEKATREAITAAVEYQRAMADADASVRGFYESFRSFAQTDEQKFIEGATKGLADRVEKLRLDLALKQSELEAARRADLDDDEIEKLERERAALQNLVIAMADRLDQERAVAREAFPLMDAERKRYEERQKAAKEAEEAAKKAAAEQVKHEQEVHEAARARHQLQLDLQRSVQEGEEANAEEAERVRKEEEQAEIEHANRMFQIDYELQLKREELIQRRIESFINEATQFASIFVHGYLQAWSRAGTAHTRFTLEYARLSRQRRAAQLLEMGVVSDGAEASAMAAQEQAAAEAEKTAAEKQGIADRMAAAAMEWAIRAIAAAASQNWGAAAAYTAAAAAAAGLAAKFHGEAKRISRNRGFTASERDTIEGLRSDIASDRATGGGTRTSGEDSGAVRERVIIYVGDPFMTPAENARAIARRMDLIDRLDLRGGEITTSLGG